MSNEQIAHDIAIALLPQTLSETNDNIYVFDDLGNGRINSFAIAESYKELYDSVLEELS